ncbi:collagen alpha-1(III) chain-like [Cervus elaphus]|uniref:collagen alpha-1(III) chain-like n=1 Tax=Cervus elaphus TaxID=9860 RepID=UPI001CC282DB|nr:collagen alpha-1(III) chain-like [Cervus elaphus]
MLPALRGPGRLNKETDLWPGLHVLSGPELLGSTEVSATVHLCRCVDWPVASGPLSNSKAPTLPQLVTGGVRTPWVPMGMGAPGRVCRAHRLSALSSRAVGPLLGDGGGAQRPPATPPSQPDPSGGRGDGVHGQPWAVSGAWALQGLGQVGQPDILPQALGTVVALSRGPGPSRVRRRTGKGSLAVSLTLPECQPPRQPPTRAPTAVWPLHHQGEAEGRSAELTWPGGTVLPSADTVVGCVFGGCSPGALLGPTRGPGASPTDFHGRGDPQTEAWLRGGSGVLRGAQGGEWVAWLQEEGRGGPAGAPVCQTPSPPGASSPASSLCCRRRLRRPGLPSTRGRRGAALTAPRLEPRPPQAWLLRGSLSPRLPTTLAHLGLWRSPWFRCFVSSPFLGLSFLTRGGARDAAGRPRPPERAGLSPGLAPNCCREGGCRPGLESCVGSGGQSAHRWAAPPALLGPEGAREGQGRGQGLGVPGASQGRRPHLPSPEGAQPGEPRAPWSVRERVSLWGPPPSTARGQEWGTSTHTRPPWL